MTAYAYPTTRCGSNLPARLGLSYPTGPSRSFRPTAPQTGNGYSVLRLRQRRAGCPSGVRRASGALVRGHGQHPLPRYHHIQTGSKVLQPRASARLRLQPRRGCPLLSGSRPPRPRLRHGLLGPRLGLGAELQRGHGAGCAAACAGSRRSSQAPPAQGHAQGAGAHPGRGRTLPAYGRRRPRAFL